LKFRQSIVEARVDLFADLLLKFVIEAAERFLRAPTP